MANYQYDTLAPIGGVLVNPYAIAARKKKQVEALAAGKILQITDGAFLLSATTFEDPELTEWLNTNRFKVTIKECAGEECRVYQHWGLRRISFDDRKMTLMFKLSNETVRI